MSKIVVGVDGSRESRAALRWALSEARSRGSTLRVVHAWSFSYLPASTGFAPVFERRLFEAARQGAENILDSELAQVAAESQGVAVERALVEGPAARALLEQAANAQVLVVGARGRGGFKGLLLGSVSQQVSQHAPCPVVLVPVRANARDGQVSRHLATNRDFIG